MLSKFLEKIPQYADRCEQYFQGLSLLYKNWGDAEESEKFLGKVVDLMLLQPIVEVKKKKKIKKKKFFFFPLDSRNWKRR